MWTAVSRASMVTAAVQSDSAGSRWFHALPRSQFGRRRMRMAADLATPRPGPERGWRCHSPRVSAASPANGHATGTNPSMRTTGGAVAEVCWAGGTAYRGRYRSGEVAGVAVLRCCTERAGARKLAGGPLITGNGPGFVAKLVSAVDAKKMGRERLRIAIRDPDARFGIRSPWGDHRQYAAQTSATSRTRTGRVVSWLHWTPPSRSVRRQVAVLFRAGSALLLCASTATIPQLPSRLPSARTPVELAWFRASRWSAPLYERP